MSITITTFSGKDIVLDKGFTLVAEVKDLLQSTYGWFPVCQTLISHVSGTLDHDDALPKGETEFYLEIFPYEPIPDETTLFKLCHDQQSREPYGPIGEWRFLPSVTSLNYLFSDCDFNEDISQWDTRYITSMVNMFSNSLFNHNIGDWKVGNVMEMNSMFKGCNVSQQNLSKWDVSHLVDASHMFLDCEGLVHNLGDWNVTNLIHASNMFGRTDLQHQDLSRWTPVSLLNSKYMFGNSQHFEMDLSKWVLSPECQRNHMFIGTVVDPRNLPP